jgi:hypothetical protein
LIEPNWILLFSKKRGRWWVRLLACGRYHHVKAIAYLPAMRAWLFYDVKFNGTRLMLAREDDPDTRAFCMIILTAAIWSPCRGCRFQSVLRHMRAFGAPWR